jgi:hypothetical protein
MIDVQAKMKAVAEMLEGTVIEDSIGLEVQVKGSVSGFPSTLQALRAGFPFGITYIVEVNVMEDEKQEDPLNMTIMPRYARGWFGFITRLLLLESKGQMIGDKKFDSKFLLSFNEHNIAERFIKYPGVIEKIEALQMTTKFSEMGVKSKAGLYLTQPTNFNSVNLDVVRVTFKTMGEIGQVLFEAF